MSTIPSIWCAPDVPDAVGFIGLGNMGWPMALNLRKSLPSETVLYIYDVRESVCDALHEHVRAGAGEPDSNNTVVICANAREVACNCRVTFIIVPEGQNVRAVFLEPDTGILAAPASALTNATFIDCSTIDPATSRAVAQAVTLAEPTAHYYDTPVSGGTAGAVARKLAVLAGAKRKGNSANGNENDEDNENEDSDNDASNFHRVAAPLLKAAGCAHLLCAGGPGLGLVAKLCNNYLSGIIAIATSEAMNIGMRHGLDAKVLSECFQRSSGANWVNETTNPVPGVCPDAVTSRGYQGGFKVQLMRKDFALAVDAAREVDAKLVLGDSGLATYTAASEDPRCRDLDSRVVYRWLGGKE